MSITAPENNTEIVPPLPGAVVSDWGQWENHAGVRDSSTILAGCRSCQGADKAWASHRPGARAGGASF